MNYKILAKFTGLTLRLVSVVLLLPLALCLADTQMRTALAFLATLAVCLCGVVVLHLVGGGAHKTVYIKDGFAVVAVCWIAVSLIGALPFWLGGWIPSFLDAFFESTSGFTTTGMSILADVEWLPRGLLLWRSITHWLGGMGVLVFVLAMATGLSAGDKSINVMRAESPGPAPGKLVPKLRQSAKILYIIYLSLTLAEAALLIAGGVPLFDSVCTAMSTAGTGGFAVRNASVADYGPFAEAVIFLFMFLFGINFNIFYFLMVRNVAGITRNDELKAYFIITAGTILLVAHDLTGEVFATFGQSLRYAAFQVTSFMTTTGFSTAEVDLWPTFSKAVLLLLMFVGSCAGSTSGGIKVSRIIILVREVRRVLFQITHPRSVEMVKMDGKALHKTVVHSVGAYCTTYMILFFFSFLILAWEGQEFTATFTTVLACLGNVGRSFGSAGPGCDVSALSALSKLVLCADMLLGRLEIYPMLLLFSPRMWRRV